MGTASTTAYTRRRTVVHLGNRVVLTRTVNPTPEPNLNPGPVTRPNAYDGRMIIIITRIISAHPESGMMQATGL